MPQSIHTKRLSCINTLDELARVAVPHVALVLKAENSEASTSLGGNLSTEASSKIADTQR
ncbi:MAG: hypothetical protein DSZ03_01955 [Sulfurimonas sp.]|nr:MAG: hypothetical protein DSZ03_01955 [Sulfurimonas sp.]